MKMHHGKKGVVQLFLGFGTILLILIVVYVLISLNDPETASRITGAVSQVSQAVKGN